MNQVVSRCALLAMLAVIAVLVGWGAPAPSVAAAPTFQRTDISTAESGGPRSRAESLAVANLDGVHGPDIVLGLFNPATATLPDPNVPDQVGVLLNNGDGTFAPMVRHDSCAAGVDVHTVDLNQDGNQDVVEACFDPMALLRGDGHGGLSAPALLGCCGFGHVIPAVLTPGAAPVLVFPSQWDAHFHRRICFVNATTPAHVVPSCGNAVDPQPAFMGEYPLAAADLLTPGYADIIAPNVTDIAGGLSIYTLDSTRGYTAWADDSDSSGAPAGCSSQSCVRSVLATDVTGDGRPDIITGHGDSTGGSISVTVNTPTQVPDAPNTTFPSVFDPQVLGAGDFDRDGHTDIVAASGYGTLAFHHGNGDGTFAPMQPIPLLGYGNPAYATAVSMKVADFNGDGAPDVAVADQLGNTLEILINTVPGPSGKPPPGGGGGATAAVLSALRVKPSAFTAAASGPSATAAASKRSKQHPKPGTTVSYRLSAAAGVRFAIAQHVAGRLRGHGRSARCEAPTKHNRKFVKCTRSVTLAGAFSQMGRRGANSFHFTGRLHFHKLGPGTYTLIASTPGPGKVRQAVTTGFQITG